MTTASHQPIVAIIGAGFGGLRAARALASAPVQVTLYDRRNYHLFQPLLYQVATAGLSPDEIAHPVRGILRKQANLTFHMNAIAAIDLDARQLTLDDGSHHPYDYLIVAVGGETNFFGLRSVAEHSFSLKDVSEAIAIRNQVLQMFE